MGGASMSKSSSSQSISDIQAPFLQQLFEQASGVTQGQMGPGGTGDVAQGLVGQLMPQGQQGLSQALGAGQGLNQFTQPNGQLVQDQIQGVTQDLNQNLQENILPGLTSSAIGGGNLGGSRGALAAGQAAAGTQRAIGQASSGIRQNAFNTAAGAAAQQGQLNLQGGLGGIQGASSLFNLGLSPLQAEFGPLQQFASILGSPIVLGESSSMSAGFSVG